MWAHQFYLLRSGSIYPNNLFIKLMVLWWSLATQPEKLPSLIMSSFCFFWHAVDPCIRKWSDSVTYLMCNFPWTLVSVCWLVGFCLLAYIGVLVYLYVCEYPFIINIHIRPEINSPRSFLGVWYRYQVYQPPPLYVECMIQISSVSTTSFICWTYDTGIKCIDHLLHMLNVWYRY